VINPPIVKKTKHIYVFRDNRSVRRGNLQLVIREIDTSIGHKSENVIVT